MTANEVIISGLVLALALGLMLLPVARRVWWEWRNRDEWKRF